MVKIRTALVVIHGRMFLGGGLWLMKIVFGNKVAIQQQKFIKVITSSCW